MDMGIIIKALRTGKGLTQEKLAQTLNVTPQAVSRWENGAALPDISLLPALSVCFGVRIDDLFALSDEVQFDRIDSMTEREDFLSREDFDYARRFLEDRAAADSTDARALRTLAELYNHRADGYHRKAEVLAKRALALEPTVKAGHAILSYAANGACWDWCSGNHRELIDYYYAFVAKNPDYLSGYLWLMDNLLADGRLDDTLDICARMERVAQDYHGPLYRGYVLALKGEQAGADAVWQRMLDADPENWIVWSVLGDARVKLCRYEEAIACYRRAAELEPAPQYIDNYDSIGQICELLGRWSDAAEAYDKVIELYRRDGQTDECFYVKRYLDAALRCRTKAK